MGGYERWWTVLFLAVLFAAAIVLIGCILLFAYRARIRPPEEETGTLDTLPPLHVPKTLVTRMTPSLGKPRPLPGITPVTTSLERGHVVPSPRASTYECKSPLCRSEAQWMRSNIDFNIDPCNDFYKFVCGSFRGENTFYQLRDSIGVATRAGIISSEIPTTNQLAWQKAAAMYQACVSFASSYMPETIELVKWMISMNLDFINTTRLLTVNPVEVMVRGSLDLGVEPIISIRFDERQFVRGKRVIQIDYSKEQDVWLQKRSLDWLSTTLSDYSLYFLMYGMRRKDVYKFAGKIRRYETELEAIAKATVDWDSWDYVEIYKLGQDTTPYVTPGDWGTFISKYTNGTYTDSDKIVRILHSTRIVKNLYASEYVGKRGLQYLVAWGIYRQLAEFTEPYLFRGERSPEDSCYVHVKNVMNLAVINRYFLSVVPPRVVTEARRLVIRIQKNFETALNSSSWLSKKIREGAINKLNSITALVGSPGRRLDPDFVEEFYKPLPDVPLNRLFPSWIKARSISTHYFWSDQKNVLYDEEDVNTYYVPDVHSILLPTAILQRPFLYLDGPSALNYGGLGSLIGHEFMHAFDVIHIKSNYWEMQKFKQEYISRTHCLRRSRKSVLSVYRHPDTLDDDVDSESLADLVGARLAYDTFSSFPDIYKGVTLAGFNMSSEQLFFINHCVKLCAEKSMTTKRYAPYRSRCIVPLRNMPEFSSAFGCQTGTLMNPQEKCSFW